MRFCTLLLIFFATLLPLGAREFVSVNDQARFIAGLPLPVSSPLEAYTHDPGWRAHAAEMDSACGNISAI